MLILFTVNIKFNTIISSCNSFDIEINEFVHLNTFEIVKKYNCEQVNEYSYRCCYQTEFFSLVLILFWNKAYGLSVEIRLIIARICLSTIEIPPFF